MESSTRQQENENGKAREKDIEKPKVVDKVGDQRVADRHNITIKESDTRSIVADFLHLHCLRCYGVKPVDGTTRGNINTSTPDITCDPSLASTIPFRAAVYDADFDTNENRNTIGSNIERQLSANLYKLPTLHILFKSDGGAPQENYRIYIIELTVVGSYVTHRIHCVILLDDKNHVVAQMPLCGTQRFGKDEEQIGFSSVYADSFSLYPLFRGLIVVPFYHMCDMWISDNTNNSVSTSTQQ